MFGFCLRTCLLLVCAFSLTACELVGDIFQVGFTMGAIIVLLIVGLLFWMARRFRG